MRMRLTAVLLPLTICLALVVYAQTQRNSMGSASQEENRSMTLTGCLQAGSEPNTYTLSNVSMSRSRSSGAPNEMARTETSYKLIPEGNVNLKDHVGHKVEITGTPAKEESSMGTSTSSSGEYSGTSSSPELKVSSIRHIAKTCP